MPCIALPFAAEGHSWPFLRDLRLFISAGRVVIAGPPGLPGGCPPAVAVPAAAPGTLRRGHRAGDAVREPGEGSLAVAQPPSAVRGPPLALILGAGHGPRSRQRAWPPSPQAAAGPLPGRAGRAVRPPAPPSRTPVTGPHGPGSTVGPRPFGTAPTWRRTHGRPLPVRPPLVPAPPLCGAEKPLARPGMPPRSPAGSWLTPPQTSAGTQSVPAPSVGGVPVRRPSRRPAFRRPLGRPPGPGLEPPLCPSPGVRSAPRAGSGTGAGPPP